ncbi:MAG: Fic family protein [archaeon]
MVYIYKKTVGEKNYYYLRASKRGKGKVVSKDIAYLGNSVREARKALNNLQKHKKDIEKAHRKINLFLDANHFLEQVKTRKLKKDEFLDEALFEVEACKMHYNNVFKKQDELTKKEMLKNFVIDFAFNTTSIEGNTISLKEARNLLEEGLTPKGKTLREIYDLQNTEKVFNSLNLKKELSYKLITGIHSELMQNIDSRTGYRTRDVIVTRSRFKSSPFYLVKIDMELLLKWVKKNTKKLHPFVLATVFHHKFEKIHPFMDGNGRTGRILLNFILMKNNYPPLITQKKYRQEYLDSMNKADKSLPLEARKEHYNELIKFTAEELKEGYWNNFL